MRAIDILKSPIWAAELATGAKSFCNNPLIGSRRLNERGLHVKRMRLAEQMSDWRRKRLLHLVSSDDSTQFDQLGYIHRPDVLPPEDLQALRSEVETTLFHAWDMRQGNAVTRFVPLPPAVLKDLPYLKAFVQNDLFQNSLRYAASTDADPIVYLHVVFTEPAVGDADPQTCFHSDTFHSTAKSWFFLYDVAMEDGPFTYVPGSHRLTPARAEWEQRQSVEAAHAENGLHARGSFRIELEELQKLGFAEPVRFAVPGNSLVVADTHGFHARGRSTRPSVRVGVYGSLRRNPYLPVTGLDPLLLPGLNGRQALLHMKTKELQCKIFRKANSHFYAGKVALTASPQI